MAVGECGLDYWKNFDERCDETEILGRRIIFDQPNPSEIRPYLVFINHWFAFIRLDLSTDPTCHTHTCHSWEFCRGIPDQKDLMERLCFHVFFL